MPELYGLILTGGSGTRLWPRSREDLPKQFLALSGTRTLFQETIVRKTCSHAIGDLRHGRNDGEASDAVGAILTDDRDRKSVV